MSTEHTTRNDWDVLQIHLFLVVSIAVSLQLYKCKG